MAFKRKNIPGAAQYGIRVKCKEARIFYFTSYAAREAFKKKMKSLGCTVLSEWYD